MPKWYTSISVKDDLADKIKGLEVVTWGVNLSSINEKLEHLLRFYKKNSWKN